MADLFMTFIAAGEGPSAFGLQDYQWVSLSMAVLIGVIIWKKVPGMIAGGLDDRISAIKHQLDEAKALRAEAVKGDALSWWATTPGGEEICCRVTRAREKPRLATLFGEPRLQRLADLAGVDAQPRPGEGSGVTCIYKSPGVEEGLSDLPWHRDCGMGGWEGGSFIYYSIFIFR